MKLQIEEYLMPPHLQDLYDIGAFRIKKLHTDLHIWSLFSQLVEKAQRFLTAAEITCDYYVFSH